MIQVYRATLEGLPPGFYDRLTARSFFASRGFLGLWGTRGGLPAAWVAEADGSPAAILPGVEFGRGLLSRFVSLPDGCYGGPFFDPTAPDHPALAEALLERIARHGYGRIHLFDFHRLLPRASGFDVAACSARVAEIETDGPWPRDAKLRSQIRKAQREGIEVIPYDAGKHHAALLGLVALTYRRHGLAPRYSPAFHESLARLAREDPRVIWMWCERDGCAASSHVYFLQDGAVQAWQSYFDRRFSYLKPNAYIRWVVARQAAERGVTRLNLGSTPPGAAGLACYKARWGGREVPFPCHVHVREPFRMWAAMRARVPSRLPQPPLSPARSR